MVAERIIVAGFGNVLRGDDGFGVVVARRLAAEPVPAEVQVMDIGIGGIHLVQELLDPREGLIIIDAVDLGRPPGSIVVTRPDIKDVTALPTSQRRDALADMHYATPERALMLADGMGIVPPATYLVGCQLQDAESLDQELSHRVHHAVDVAVAEVRRLVSGLGIDWQ